jgi:hypothetical protein
MPYIIINEPTRTAQPFAQIRSSALYATPAQGPRGHRAGHLTGMTGARERRLALQLKTG